MKSFIVSQTFLFIVVVLVCGHDSFENNVQLKMRFGTHYWSPKRKNELLKQPYPKEISKIRAILVFLKTIV